MSKGREPVVMEMHDHICLVRLHKPETRNALDVEMASALASTLENVRSDQSIRAVLLTGGQHFMAGGDIRYFAQHMHQEEQEWSDTVTSLIADAHRSITAISNMEKPVLASVDGAAAGYGLSLAMACDFVVCSRTAVMTLAYVHIGASPDGGSTFALPRLVGMRRATQIAMLGDRFSADDALAWGLVNEVVDPEGLEEASWRWASRLSQLPTRAIGRTKMLLRQSLDHSLTDQLDAEMRQFATTSTEPDFREGVTAFLEKRRPDFKG